MSPDMPDDAVVSRYATLQDYVAEMYEDGKRWFPNGGLDIVTLTLGLVGEAGEVADQLKKHLRNPVDWEGRQEKIREELIDVFHYWCLLVGAFQVNVEEEYTRKREKNIARYERQPSDGA